MKQKLKKSLALLLTLAMLFSMLPGMAMAEELVTIIGWETAIKSTQGQTGVDLTMGGWANTKLSAGMSITPWSGTEANWSSFGFTFDATNHAGMSLSIDLATNGKSPQTFMAEYSVNGTNFTDIKAIDMTGANATFVTHTLNIPVGANNQSSVTIRFRQTSGVQVDGKTALPASGAGSLKVKNILVTKPAPPRAQGHYLPGRQHRRGGFDLYRGCERQQ